MVLVSDNESDPWLSARPQRAASLTLSFAFAAHLLMAHRHDASLLPFGSEDAPANLSPALEQCAMNLYRQAWSAYRTVDCPYGETDKAMLVWYTFQDHPERPSLLSGRN